MTCMYMEVKCWLTSSSVFLLQLCNNTFTLCSIQELTFYEKLFKAEELRLLGAEQHTKFKTFISSLPPNGSVHSPECTFLKVWRYFKKISKIRFKGCSWFFFLKLCLSLYFSLNPTDLSIFIKKFFIFDTKNSFAFSVLPFDFWGLMTHQWKVTFNKESGCHKKITAWMCWQKHHHTIPGLSG